jgi:hypothetical protein
MKWGTRAAEFGERDDSRYEANEKPHVSDGAADMGHPVLGCPKETQIPFGNDKQRRTALRVAYFFAVAKRLLISAQLTVFHQAAR